MFLTLAKAVISLLVLRTAGIFVAGEAAT